MNYREYQQVMKLGSGSSSGSSKKHSSQNSSRSNSRSASPITSPLSSPRLQPQCSHVENSNYKIQKKPKITRSKTGCLCCRKRRKKCDEVHPKCGGCTRNFLDCCWPDNIVSKGSSPHSHQAAMRASASPAVERQRSLSVSSDEGDSVPASFSLNNNIMVIQDGHLVTRTSVDSTGGDQNFIITAIKSSSVEHIMREHITKYPRSIPIKSLLN